MKDETIGLLFSQVGYDIDKPKKIFVRGPENFFNNDAKIQIFKNGEDVFIKKLKYFGNCWNINWWGIDFSEFNKKGNLK